MTAILTNFLWIRKAEVPGHPDEFAPEWTHKIPLLKTPEGRIAQQQLSWLQEQAQFDPDFPVESLTQDDYLTVANWSSHEKWWALCCGDEKKVKALVDRLGLTLDDRRVSNPWPDDIDLKMTLPPRAHQVPVIGQWKTAGHGILKAAPAFGKTFCFIDAIVSARQYTLALVHTDYLAGQIIERLRLGTRTDDGGYLHMTNCQDVEATTGREVVKRLRTIEDFAPVNVATWQTFLSEAGQKLLKEVSKRYGQIVCDEAHVYAAPAPARVVNSFHCRRLAVTATPTRKDKLDVALYDTVGPITARGVAPQMPVTAYMIATGVNVPPSRYPGQAEFARVVNNLCKSHDRNDLIEEWLRHDYEEGRSVLVLCDRVKWSIDMAKRLNKIGIPSAAVVGGSSKKHLAERARTVNDMMEGKIRVIFATQVFKVGVDIPCLDGLYCVTPMNNEEMLDQMLGRVRRWYEKKLEPVVRVFVDGGHGLLYGCAKGTQRHLTNLSIPVYAVEVGVSPVDAAIRAVFSPSGGLKGSNNGAHAVSSMFGKEKKQANTYQRRLGDKPVDKP